MISSPLGTWRKPPLAYVVAELIFSPHYGIKSAIPIIQQFVRDRFPRTVEATELVIDPNTPPVAQTIWRLLSVDQTQGIQIGTRSISLHVTSYTNSEVFLQQWSEVLAAFESAHLGAFVERAGVRYLDLVVPSEGHEPKDYLIPELRGLPAPEGGRTETSMWAAIYSVDSYRVQAKAATPSTPGMILPPDFSALPLLKPAIWIEAEKRAQDNKALGFIDTDCMQNVQALFDAHQLAVVYAALRGHVAATFRSLMSPLAKEEWM